MLKQTLTIALVAVTAFSVATPLPAEEPAKAAATAAEQFARIKKLAGEWVAADAPSGEPARVLVVFRVTAGGSVVQETLFPGTDHEMITMYHVDGDALVLTHYCAAGNQPRMKARPGPADEAIEFEFAGGANIDPDVSAHMHSARIEPRGEDRVRSEWRLFADGKQQDVKSFDLVRRTGE